jgi:release factor glutamine methyltransferase
MLSWGHVRRALQPLLLKYWIEGRSQRSVKTSVEGFELVVFPTVFHPRYFGSSAIFAHFISSLPLKGKSFLDLGCGSGIVALCAARLGASVTAVDINPEAVRCTLENALRHDLPVQVYTGDLFSSVGDAQYDVVACNPPFLLGIPQSQTETAFYGGFDFDMIRKFAAGVRAHLRPGGSIFTILSSDIDIYRIEEIFRAQHLNVSYVLTTRWMLHESMVILCAR